MGSFGLDPPVQIITKNCPKKINAEFEYVRILAPEKSERPVLYKEFELVQNLVLMRYK